MVPIRKVFLVLHIVRSGWFWFGLDGLAGPFVVGPDRTVKMRLVWGGSLQTDLNRSKPLYAPCFARHLQILLGNKAFNPQNVGTYVIFSFCCTQMTEVYYNDFL